MRPLNALLEIVSLAFNARNGPVPSFKQFLNDVISHGIGELLRRRKRNYVSIFAQILEETAHVSWQLGNFTVEALGADTISSEKEALFDKISMLFDELVAIERREVANAVVDNAGASPGI